jgi:hypothetical protein
MEGLKNLGELGTRFVPQPRFAVEECAERFARSTRLLVVFDRRDEIDQFLFHANRSAAMCCTLTRFILVSSAR